MWEMDPSGHPVLVSDLDAELLLALAEDAEVKERQAIRAKLRLAAQWCVLHPATSETGPATWADAALPGALDCDETIGGDGTPAVAAFTAEPLAAALGISTAAGLQLVADGLNLVHRLPRIWARVESLEVPGWRARRIAQATAALSQEAAAYVDAALAARVDSCGAVTIDRVVAEAIARFDPDLQAEREAAARRRWDVRLTKAHPAGEYAGTSWLDAAGDTLDLTRFHDLVCAVAERLRKQGDDDPLGVRKARALGVIADQAQGLDPDSRSSAQTKLYLHLDAADLANPGAIGAAEGLGPVTADRIREWLAGSRATIQPMLDLARVDAVDRHDPPLWMRELVVLRDRHCVFPWCQRDARSCDLDHIESYQDPDDGGTPGQTHPENLAPLCRRHHRAKTAGRWRYRREDGTYTWTGPHDRSYAVTPRGTVEVG